MLTSVSPADGALADITVAREIVRRLNALIAADAAAKQLVDDLISPSVVVDQAFAERHPTIQVGKIQDEAGCVRYAVGFLGMLNGIVGVHQQGTNAGAGLIMACYDSDGRLTGFDLSPSDRDRMQSAERTLVLG